MKHNQPWLRKEIEKIFDKEALDEKTTDGEAEWIGGIHGEIEELLDKQNQELREIAEKHRRRREDGSISSESRENLPQFIETEFLGEEAS